METATHHCLEIPKKELKIYVPKELAHCDQDEYNDICELLFDYQTGAVNYEDFKVHATYLVLDLKPGKRKISKQELEIMYANIGAVSQIIDTFFNSTEDGNVVKQNYSHNHNPWVRPVFTKNYGPKNEFSNVSFGQYEDGLNLFHLYNEYKDVDLLYLLMSTFYLPKGQKYDADKVEKRSKKFKLLHFGQIYGFYLFFGAFQLYLTTSKVVWEGREIDLGILYRDQDSGFKSEIPSLGAKSIAYQLAESGVFGSLKELRSEKLWEILLRLYDIRKREIDEAARLEEEKRNAK